MEKIEGIAGPLRGEIAKAVEGIDRIVLIGGPMGVGKTTLARRLAAGEVHSDYLTGYAGCISRTDAKSLSRKRFPPGGLIVEFATNRLSSPEHIEATEYYVRSLQEITQVVGAHTFIVDRSALFLRYLNRMTARELLHLGKLKTLARYAVQNRERESISNWEALLARCGIRNSPASTV